RPRTLVRPAEVGGGGRACISSAETGTRVRHNVPPHAPTASGQTGNDAFVRCHAHTHRPGSHRPTLNARGRRSWTWSRTRSRVPTIRAGQEIMSRSRLTTGLILALAVALAPAGIHAQAETGTIRGQVSSSNGEPIAEAQAAVLGTVRGARSDQNGTFVIDA